MIYLFFGEKHFRGKLLNTWKKAFSEKYGELNIFHVKNYSDYDFAFYSQNFLGGNFFATKTFFIIDDFPFSVGEKDDNILKYQEFFLQILDKVSSENIVVFNNSNIDKRSKIFKKISEIGEIKDFSIKDRDDLKEKIKEVYGEFLTIGAINKLIELKGEDFLAIENEIEKLLLTKTLIDVKDLENISSNIDENIFEIINDILNLDTKNAISKLRKISESLDNPFLLYNMILSNLRLYFYIFSLKKLGVSKEKIVEKLALGNRGFLVGKSYKISYERFIKMYEKLAKIDEKLKTGKLIGSDNRDFIYEMEKSLIVC